MAGSTARPPVHPYDEQVSGIEPEPDAAPAVGRWRGALYSVAVGGRSLAAVIVVALLGAPIVFALTGNERGTGTVGALLVAGLALLGVGLPLIAGVLARTDWSASAALLDKGAGGRPATGLTDPRALVRPLAYVVVMLTLGGAAALFGALVVTGSLVALISPFLAAAGDQAVIGPFTVRTVPQSLLAVGVAVGSMAILIVVSPFVARTHASVVQQVLTRPEQRLQSELSRTAQSRARVVRAFDVERRRIERDLHDGVQPQLLSVSMTLGLALAAMPDDAPGRGDVTRAQDQARRALDGLRKFVRGIHPQVLIDHGLGAAIGDLADSIPIDITVDDQLTDRLPGDIETNLYFCAAELVANVVKHSGAENAEIRLRQPQPDLVEISVHDDGHGGVGTRRHENGGLDGIGDRVAAIDGQLVIDSPLGGPTTITISVAAHDEGSADE